MIKKTDIKPGVEIRCKIEGIFVKRAKIQIQDQWVWICQNIKAGDSCLDKLGFKYSWNVSAVSFLEDESTQKFFKRTDVTGVELLNTEWDEEENE